jgi:hypothetical protein
MQDHEQVGTTKGAARARRFSLLGQDLAGLLRTVVQEYVAAYVKILPVMLILI